MFIFFTNFNLLFTQVSSAVAYLHSCDIIYRDLKAENVLVWDLPDPFSQATSDTVKVKLADYGISVSALPSGTKGYGGTPGYMAPEIVVYDGKETYNEKVSLVGNSRISQYVAPPTSTPDRPVFQLSGRHWVFKDDWKLYSVCNSLPPMDWSVTF